MADKLIKTLNFGTGDTYHLAPEWDNIQNKPEDIGGGGGKADSVDWEDVQNKPFGYSEGRVLIDNQTTTEGRLDSSEITLTAGSAYNVTLNGTVYECTAKEENLFGMELIVVGDLGIVMGEPDGSYPFVLAYMGGQVTFSLADTSSDCTVTVTEFEFTKIPESYYTASKVTTFYSSAMNGYLYNDFFCEGEKTTSGEVKEALKKGSIVISYLDSAFFFPTFIQYIVEGEEEYANICSYMNGTATAFYTAEKPE